jgi:transcriptional regulator with XRE-family HTH domain
MAALASAMMSEDQARRGRELDPDTALAAAVAELRAQAQLSQAELARQAGFDEGEIAAIEAARLEPTWGDLRRLARALQITLPELFARVESHEGR